MLGLACGGAVFCNAEDFTLCCRARQKRGHIYGGRVFAAIQINHAGVPGQQECGGMSKGLAGAPLEAAAQWT